MNEHLQAVLEAFNIYGFTLEDLNDSFGERTVSDFFEKLEKENLLEPKSNFESTMLNSEISDFLKANYFSEIKRRRKN